MELPQLVAVESCAGGILGRLDRCDRALRAIEGRSRVPAQERKMRQPAPDRRRWSGVGELRVGVSRGRQVAELEARVADDRQRIELAGVGREGRLRLLQGAAEVVKREEDGRAQGMAGPEDRVGLDRSFGCVESTLVVAKVTGDPGTLQVSPPSRVAAM